MGFFTPPGKTQLPPPERAAFLGKLKAAFAVESQVVVAFVFGSFARGEPFADIDIGVQLDEPFTAMDVARLATRLWLATGGPSHELDVVPLNDAPPSFRLEVTQGIAIHQRFEGAAADFKVMAWSEKLDFDAALAAMNSIDRAMHP